MADQTVKSECKGAGMKFVILSILYFMFISSPRGLQAQQIYTWTDEKGITHLTDHAPPKEAKVEDVFKYREKTPQEKAAIEREIEELRTQNERQEKIDAAQRAAVEAREAEKRAQEQLQSVQEQAESNQEYVRRLSSTKQKRKQFRKKIQRIIRETNASQVEAEAAVQQAEEAAQKAQKAAAEAEETE